MISLFFFRFSDLTYLWRWSPWSLECSEHPDPDVSLVAVVSIDWTRTVTMEWLTRYVMVALGVGIPQ
jgi:hypothetical protein